MVLDLGFGIKGLGFCCCCLGGTLGSSILSGNAG